MKKTRQPAQYLLRIDDLCETVHHERWRRIRALLREFSIRPILAVVPENRDPELAVSPVDGYFWDTMREMEADGAAIALHGFRHVCVRRRGGLLPLSCSGEFAGAPFAIQQEWISRGLAILRREGLTPKMWVAPRHNFDINTLLALRREGISYLSDGLMREPNVRGGVVWIPQQLWAPVEKRAGLWTICIHPNTLDDPSLRKLRGFLGGNARQFTTFDRVVREFIPRPASWTDALRQRAGVARIRFRRSFCAWRGRKMSDVAPAEGSTDLDRESPIDRESWAG